jgi:hypothetical protein
MEIDITEFFNSETVDMSDISGSVMEHGPNAARITWNNAREASKEYRHLTTVDQLAACRNHLEDMGYSDMEDASDDDLNALFLQLVAGDIREVPGMDDGWNWEVYESFAREGTVHGAMYRGDNGRVYYYLGS